MKSRRNISILLTAALGSLVIHSLGGWTAYEFGGYDLEVGQLARVHGPATQPVVAIVIPVPQQKQSQASPPPAPKPRPSLDEKPRTPLLVDEDYFFGQRDGTGEGTNKSQGDKKLSGILADAEQAAISRHHNDLQASLQPDPEPAEPSQMQPPGADQAPPIPPPAPPVASPDTPPAQPVAAVPLDEVKTLAYGTITPPPAPAPQTPPPPKEQPPVSNAPAIQPKNSSAKADPRQASESDSDAFSHYSVEYRGGKLEPHLGRHVITIEPVIRAGGLMALEAISMPHELVQLTWNSRGEVVDVQFIEKTGAGSVDEPIRQALYMWRITELDKDASGNPVGGSVKFAIVLYN